MRKYLFYLVLTVLAISSCGKDDTKKVEEEKNPMIGTQWEAKDEIASLIWGSTISRIEFLDGKNFQDIAITKGSVRKTEEGTYTYSGGNVTLNYPKDRVLRCVVKGSIMTTSQGQPSGGYMTYQKK